MAMDQKELFYDLTGIPCRRVSELSGGKTNHSYLVQTDNGEYVLRIPGEGTNEYISRSDETGNLRAVSKLDFVPSTLYADEKSGIIITRYIRRNTPMSTEDIHSPAHLNGIMSVLARLHRSDVRLVNEFDIQKNKQHYIDILSEMKTPLPGKLLKARPRLEEAVSYLFSRYPKQLVPCHGDPKFNNFLLGQDRMFLIDWEYSGLADPCFDLVNMLLTNHITDEADRALLLKAYEEQTREHLEPEKVLLYEIATDDLWIYWHLIKLFQGQDTEYNAFSWEVRLDRAVKNIRKLERSA